MRLRPEQLSAHLAQSLAPLYVVYGDEPLLAIEAGDAIRAAARAAGCEEREVLVVEPGFKWDAFSAASRNLGLFGTRKLVDLRIPGGKPAAEALAHALKSTEPALRDAAKEALNEIVFPANPRSIL